MPDQPVKKPKMLLHVCCIGCGAHVSRVLKEDFEIELFFYNPNIYSKAEYDKRLEETRRIAAEFGLVLFAGEYDHAEWLRAVKGHERDSERGERCQICYRYRLEKTARQARENNFEYFTTTLSISPHKDADSLNKIGQELAGKYKLKYYVSDFKKRDGFKKASALSRELNLYRQDYCGCEFSLNQTL